MLKPAALPGSPVSWGCLLRLPFAGRCYWGLLPVPLPPLPSWGCCRCMVIIKPVLQAPLAATLPSPPCTALSAPHRPAASPPAAGPGHLWQRHRHRLFRCRGCCAHRVCPPHRPPLPRLQVCVCVCHTIWAVSAAERASLWLPRIPPSPFTHPNGSRSPPDSPACSLDTGRLNPETYRLFDKVEKHYNIRIEYTFPDAQVNAVGKGGEGGRLLLAVKGRRSTSDICREG